MNSAGENSRFGRWTVQEETPLKSFPFSDHALFRSPDIFCPGTDIPIGQSSEQINFHWVKSSVLGGEREGGKFVSLLLHHPKYSEGKIIGQRFPLSLTPGTQ